METYVKLSVNFGYFRLNIGYCQGNHTRRKLNRNGYSQNRNSSAQLVQREKQ